MRNWVAVLAGMVAALVSAAPSFAQKQGGTLRISHRDNPPSASIHDEATISVNQPFMAVFNNLVFFDPNKKLNSPDDIVPELAESWSWNADKTRLTFKLRQGVKWHDGKPFTSADVNACRACSNSRITGWSPGKSTKPQSSSLFRKSMIRCRASSIINKYGSTRRGKRHVGIVSSPSPPAAEAKMRV